MSGRILCALVGMVCLAPCIIGCNSEKGARVTGVILENDQPLQVTEKEAVLLGFVPIQVDDQSLKAHPGATFKREDSSFQFIGPGLGLVPPGDYKVTVVVRSHQGVDRLGGQFSLEKTPLRYTVTDEPKQDIFIDVRKKTVTRNGT